MSPPPAGNGGRTPLGRLVDALRRRLRPDRGAPPATVPGLGSGEETALSAAAKDDAPEAPGAELAANAERAVTADEPMPLTEGSAEADPASEDADARFDAARDRLRSTIEPPPDPDDTN